MNMIGSSRLPLLGYVVAHLFATVEGAYETTTIVAGAPTASEPTTRSFEADVDDALNLLSRKALPMVSELLTSGELGPACSSSLIKLFLHLRLKEPWALRMVTANGLVPTNLLEGSLVSLGGYEQCLKTRFHDYQGELLFKGRYCTLFAQMPKDAMRDIVKRFHAVGMLRIVQALLWLLSTAAACFVLFVTLPWNRGNLPDPIPNAIYGGYHRLLWSLSLCWPAYACATGYGGMIARMSSWKGFVPLARLTYGVYLLQGVFLLLRMALVKTRFNLDDFFQLTNTLGIIGISYYFAYLLFLLCDAPIENFYEHVFGSEVAEASQLEMATPRPAQTIHAHTPESTTRDFEADIQRLDDIVVKKILSYSSEIMSTVDVSSECMSGLLRLIMALKRQEPWALRMIFANAFLPNNLLEYSVSNLGGYEQCLRTVAPTHDPSAALRGQYCTMTFRISKRYAKSLVKKFNTIGDLEGRFDLYALPDKIRGRDYAFLLGICGPSTCSQGDLRSLIHAAASTYGFNTTVKGCRIRKPLTVAPFQAVSISILGFILALVVAGTSADLLARRTLRCEETNKYGENNSFY
ncbi:hypothetical protein MTO96_006200 [Rhipicephalus appendiculatus]